MDRLDAMQVFVRVAEVGSFTRTADELGLPKASISNAVQQLEKQLDVRLLNRTTRKVAMTEEGRVFYERCVDLLADMDELGSLFQGDTAVSGRLRVDMPTGMAKNFVLPNLADFLGRYPQLQIEISSSDRRVDVIREGFDCVIRVGELDDSALIARKLGDMKIINCVSPGYIETWGEPRHLEQLSEHRLVHYSPTLGAHAGGWEYWDGETYRSVDMPGLVTVNNTDAYSHACLSGLGIIQVPEVGVRRYLESGEMVEVLKAFHAQPMPVSLVYPHRRHLARRVRVFMDWVAELLSGYIHTDN
ncbi:LysR family transcriptional regulator [Marinobacterium lutimaris]|nr:LysR family transcriptional regulator [Marinobacterium lutimaris]